MKLESIKRMKELYLYQTYEDIYVTNNLVNIQQVHAEDLEIKERDNYNYILTYSFPCQDLSLAGKTAGMKKGSGTRSGMLWEVERILEECGEELPQILLMENVPQVVGKKNKEDFDNWVSFLESKGYTNKYCMLNAKEVGYPEPIPQNRNRCFMVSVLNPKCDIVFPEKTERKTILKDLLEEQVDEKYYLSDKQLESLESGIYNASKPSVKIGITDKGICQTLDTMSGGNRQPFVRVKNATKQGYLEATDGDGVNIGSRMQYQRGNVQKGMIQTITTLGGTDRGVVTNITCEDKWSDLD